MSTTELDRNTASQQSWNLILHWLRECQEDHDMCRIINPVQWLPTRLLDIGCDNSLTIKLFIPSEHPEMLDQPYVTLSHCWGKGKILRLLQENIESMKNEILIESLPKTFQETIVIARRLKQRFLWIDSLCIIQDSEEDWQIESAMMEYVYGHSLLNIAATDSSSGIGG